MMEKDTGRKLKLGIFVIAGVLLMITTLYLVGRNRNIFSQSVTLVIFFNNVSGLQAGSNVRFGGIDAGTVKSVEVVSANLIRVILSVNKKYQSFIAKNAFATIGTDGFVGNKIINITQPREAAAPITDDDTIEGVTPLEADEMLRTLNHTNQQVAAIAVNLKNLTDEIGSSKGTVWKLLTDQDLSSHFDSMMRNMHQTTKHIYNLSSTLSTVAGKIRRGEGMLGAMVQDTVFYTDLQKTMSDLKVASRHAASASNDIDGIVREVEQGRGAIGMLLKDSALGNDLRESMNHIKEGSDNFNRNMEALKHSMFFRGYYKKLEKEQQASQKVK